MNDYFSKRRRETWNRIGDIYCPAYEELPPFSETGGVDHLPLVLDSAQQDDIKLLLLLMNVLSFMPTSVLTVIVNVLDKSEDYPNFVGQWCRLLRLAIKGPIVSIYYGNLHDFAYSKPLVHELIGYNVKCDPDVQDGAVGQWESISDALVEEQQKEQWGSGAVESLGSGNE